MTWSDVYGALAALCVILALWSGSVATIKMSFLMLFSWALSNIAVAAFGFVHAPSVIYAVDAVLALILGMVALQSKNGIGYAVFVLFIVEAVVHVVSFAGKSEGSLGYYVALNVIFALQTVLVGGASVIYRMVNRPIWRDIGTGVFAPRRAHHVAGAEHWET